MSRKRMIAGLVLTLAVLTGCAAQAPPRASEASPTATVDPRQACSDAAATVIDSAATVVAQYAQSDDPDAAPDAPNASDDLATAVADARDVRAQYDCDAQFFVGEMRIGLAGITPDGAIADAVLRRLEASLLGDARTAAGEWSPGEEQDLRDVLAIAAEGDVIILPAGDITLDSTLVVLDGITLRGAGSSQTTLRSTAPDAAILVATAGTVTLSGLMLALDAEDAASGLIAGPSASVALDDVVVEGAPAAKDGSGGAGVYLTSSGDAGAADVTTLEITDSTFRGNGWAGVVVAGGHRVSIESSTFEDNGDVGILFLDKASGSVSGSTFIDNEVGLAASGASTPTWTRTTVRGGTVGMQMDATSAPIIDRMTVSGAASAAAVFGGESTGVIQDSTCRNVEYGIVIADSAAPTLRDNDCVVARGG